MLGQVRVNTPEGITFSHDVAGVGSRSLAAMVDLLIIFAIIMIVQIASFLIFLMILSTGIVSNRDGGGILTAIIILIQFL